MKTNIIKSLAVGAVATVALFVSNAMADIGPLAITNWGFEPPYSGDSSSQIIEHPGIGAYELICLNHPNANMGFKAALPLPYTLQNLGDKITIHYTMIFTNTGPNLEFVGGTVWRFFIGTTNNNNMGTLGPVAGAGSPQWVGSGSVRSSNGGQYYLGYNFNFVAAGPGMPLMVRQENAARIWLSTSGNVTTMGMAGTVGSSWPNATDPNGAQAGAYYVTVSAHLAETNLIVLSYTVTNSDSATNGPNSYSDIYSVTNYGCLFDDGNLGTRLQGQCPETKRFDVVGIYHSATAPYNNDVTYSNWTETISFNNPSPYTNVVLNNFDTSAQAGIWTNWMGASTNVGDLWSTLDSSALNDGSLEKVVTNWWAVFQTQSQTWTNWDQGLSPGLTQPGLNMLEFCADVMFDSSSTVVTNTATANTNGFYGHLEFGLIDQFYSHQFQQFSNITAAGVSPTVGYDFPATNPPDSWKHLNFYFDAWNSAYEGTLNNLAIAMNANFYTAAPLTNGSSTLYVDNMHLVELQSLDGQVVPFPTPTLNIECDRDLGLRIFTQANASYTRTELVSQNSQMSWVNNATYPVTYSFTVTNLPAPSQGLQTMFWFIPVGAMPTSDQVGGVNGIGANDPTIDADATNALCLEINNQTNPTNDDYHAFVGYKINTNGLSLNLGNPPVDYYATNVSLMTPNLYCTNNYICATNPGPVYVYCTNNYVCSSNYYYWTRHVAYIKLATNYYNGNDASKYFAASGNGTWTLQFSDATHGSITGPNLSPVTFTIPGGDEQYFLNPLQLYFGTQNNGVPGNSILLMNISINGAQGELTNDFAFGKNWSDDWRAVENGSSRSTHLGLWAVPQNIAYWLNWTTPAGGYDVEVAPYLTADPVYTHVPWVEPLFYTGFSPSTLTEQVEGRNVWTYITTNNLDAMMNYYPSVKSNAFFRLHRPPKSAR
jgi:hypothetical protein